MGTHYIVILDEAPKNQHYAPGYFPRKFHYRNDADELTEQVKNLGGKAHVTPWKPKNKNGNDT